MALPAGMMPQGAPGGMMMQGAPGMMMPGAVPMMMPQQPAAGGMDPQAMMMMMMMQQQQASAADRSANERVALLAAQGTATAGSSGGGGATVVSNNNNNNSNNMMGGAAGGLASSPSMKQAHDGPVRVKAKLTSDDGPAYEAALLGEKEQRVLVPVQRDTTVGALVTKLQEKFEKNNLVEMNNMKSALSTHGVEKVLSCKVTKMISPDG